MRGSLEVGRDALAWEGVENKSAMIFGMAEKFRKNGRVFGI
jgi:hypothetical protein